MNDPIRVVEMFSGIGSQAKALEKIGVPFQVVKTCEWDIHAIIAYDRIHNSGKINPEARNLHKPQLLEVLGKFDLSYNGKDPISKATFNNLSTDVLRSLYSAILNTNNLVNITKVKGKDLPNKIDILTYSFPCQDLSNVGALHGYKKGIDRDAKNRSGLLWEIERILLERKSQNLDMPKFLLLENVSALNSKRHRANFEEWQKQLRTLGYLNHVYCLRSQDFGSAQNRTRLLMLSVFVGVEKDLETKVEEFFRANNLENDTYRQTLNIQDKYLKDILKMDYFKNKYKDEALKCVPNATPSRSKIWQDNLVLFSEKKEYALRSATITTKQDRNPNSGNVFFDISKGKSQFRYLTPRECFLLMGFSESDFEKVSKSKLTTGNKKSLFFSRDKMYKLAGNSIVVEVLFYIFQQMIQIDSSVLSNAEGKKNESVS